jgi:hypothetical protein
LVANTVMSTGTRPVGGLIGVYNADGGIVGELRYVTGKVLGRAHCALCDITHRGLTPRKEWSQACERIAVPFELVHLNERTEAVRRASEGEVPCVLAKTGDELVIVLGPDDLEACAKDVDEFERRLRSAGARLGITFSAAAPPGA